MRTTEQIAPEQLRTFTAQLSRLTSEQPTTAEIEEALVLVPQIQRVLRDWASARHLIQAHAHQAAAFRERHPHIAVVVCPAGFDLSSPFVQRGRV